MPTKSLSGTRNLSALFLLWILSDIRGEGTKRFLGAGSEIDFLKFLKFYLFIYQGLTEILKKIFLDFSFFLISDVVFNSRGGKKVFV